MVEEEKKVKRIKIDTYGNNRVPVILIDHEGWEYAFARLYYVYDNETGRAWEEDYVITADSKTIPSEEALKFYIFELKKPFKLILKEGEECSNSGAHCIQGNFVNGLTYTVKTMLRFPAYMDIFDIEKSNISDTYIAWPYYGKLLLLNYTQLEIYRTRIILDTIPNYNFEDIVEFEVNGNQESEYGGIIADNIARRDTITFYKEKYIIEQRMPVVKTKSMLIILNTYDYPFKVQRGGGREFSIPPRKAFLKIVPPK